METTQCPMCKETVMKGAKKCKHCGEKIRGRATKRYSIKNFLIGVVVLGIVLSAINGNNDSSSTLENSSTAPVQKVAQKNLSPQDRLEKIVKEQGGYTVTYIGNEQDDNIYLDITEAQGKNSIIISGPASSCKDAQRDVYEIFRGIYTTPQLSSKLGRVKVTVTNKLKASMGATDARQLNRENFGPTLMMDVYGDLGSMEIESGNLDDRTYGYFFGEC